jgi:uncharacterized protein (DUF1800 family)
MSKPTSTAAATTRRRAALSAVAVLAVASLPALAAEPTLAVVEYRHVETGDYFMTASRGEAAALDGGIAAPGWRRTGVEFHAWASPGEQAGAVPVCRFAALPERGPGGRLYATGADECARLRADPAWADEGIAFWMDAPVGNRCGSGAQPVYRSARGVAPATVNFRYLPDLTLHQKLAPAARLEGLAMCAPLTSAEVAADATRLLEQATFGPTPALVERVRTVGAAGFLAEQFAAPLTRYPDFPYAPAGQQAAFCATDPNPQCGRDHYSLFLLQNAFFANAVAGTDQLRQRVAFALSQILVTSGLDVNLVYGMAKYQQIFLDEAFGNFETILTRVTLSPVMGEYLDMVNNDKPAAGVAPNENYARELLQLFAIGVWELQPDGTLLRDAAGDPIPTYDQETIEGFAHVFTGWTYPPLPGVPARRHNPRNYLGDMMAVPANHDTGAKTLLEDAVAPAGLPMPADLANAIRNVFLHPNVGPFIGRQLIQKLVTGDPSPQYVARVAAAFADNGRGVRGDMRAVVTAILTDPEARGPVKLDAGYGKLREPVLYMTALARALNAQTDGVFLGTQSGGLGQRLFYPASVFNYYPPDYVLPGTAVIAPEFALLNATTAMNRYNFANALVYGSVAPIATLPGAIGTRPDWSTWLPLAADPAALVDRLDALLLHGTMPAAMRATVLAAITAVPATDPLARARMGFYLVATSPQYQVER